MFRLEKTSKTRSNHEPSPSRPTSDAMDREVPAAAPELGSDRAGTRPSPELLGVIVGNDPPTFLYPPLVVPRLRFSLEMCLSSPETPLHWRSPSSSALLALCGCCRAKPRAPWFGFLQLSAPKRSSANTSCFPYIPACHV